MEYVHAVFQSLFSMYHIDFLGISWWSLLVHELADLCESPVSWMSDGKLTVLCNTTTGGVNLLQSVWLIFSCVQPGASKWSLRGFSQPVYFVKQSKTSHREWKYLSCPRSCGVSTSSCFSASHHSCSCLYFLLCQKR